ncbi:MAG: VWA domain-containing protein [Proteobacteria bacterium]|nr:VWA domain-containing protein [Desulfobacterales bacterium]MBL6967959.1 VWA domain-containing protein [Desulfobacteraceae bacterium]MBU0735860.1 VWA domain-containing protein [Pseudomonadota bacterium]MBL7102182.1 VWA domain-containing protein [Desulfobacteraceae bacterium]MBL7172042.1 VWA domain-containing protein [Desulfobacteraceae bacterium]
MGSKAEAFVFSTSLTSITSMVRRLNVENALERIVKEVPGWSGGTRILSIFQWSLQ